MAWQKDIARFGRNNEKCYARLSALQVDFANKTAQMVFTVWLSEEIANSGAEPVTVISVPFEGYEFESWNCVDQFKADAYEKSATADVLSGAVEA